MIQVRFFQPMYYQGWGPYASPEIAAAQNEQHGLDDNNLPVYLLGALVDQQAGADQVHHIVLAYTNEDDAEYAAAEMVRRIPLQTTFSIDTSDQPILDLLESDYTLEPSQVVHQGNRWLAVATVPKSRCRTTIPILISGFIRVSGRLFGFGITF